MFVYVFVYCSFVFVCLSFMFVCLFIFIHVFVGSYIVTVKNPNIDSNWTNWLTSKGEPKFPKELQGSFAGLKF